MSLPLLLSPKFIADITLHKKGGDRKVHSKIWELILDILDGDPYNGLGKPEALKGDMSGWYSRRINNDDRLIYRIKDDCLELNSCYGHYGDK